MVIPVMAFTPGISSAQNHVLTAAFSGWGHFETLHNLLETKIGDNNPDAGDWELGMRTTAGGDTPVNQENFQWISHVHYPFNSMATISFNLPHQEKVTISVYNIAGQLVSTLLSEYYSAGHHAVMWDGIDTAGNKP